MHYLWGFGLGMMQGVLSELAGLNGGIRLCTHTVTRRCKLRRLTGTSSFSPPAPRYWNQCGTRRGLPALHKCKPLIAAPSDAPLLAVHNQLNATSQTRGRASRTRCLGCRDRSGDAAGNCARASWARQTWRYRGRIRFGGTWKENIAPHLLPAIITLEWIWGHGR
jgi:hypothetical protein